MSIHIDYCADPPGACTHKSVPRGMRTLDDKIREMLSEALSTRHDEEIIQGPYPPQGSPRHDTRARFCTSRPFGQEWVVGILCPVCDNPCAEIRVNRGEAKSPLE